MNRNIGASTRILRSLLENVNAHRIGIVNKYVLFPFHDCSQFVGKIHHLRQNPISIIYNRFEKVFEAVQAGKKGKKEREKEKNPR